MELKDILGNPSRMRIMQYLAIHGEVTVKELANHFPDIPRRTLYRHVDFLIEAGTIIVKEERKVRGGIERLLKDNTEAFVDNSDLSDSAYCFFMELFSRFDAFNKKPHKNFKEEFNFQRSLLNLRRLIMRNMAKVPPVNSEVFHLSPHLLSDEAFLG